MLPAGGLAQSSIRDVGFDLSKFTYLAKITTAPRFLFVKGDSPIKTLDALIAEGKKRPLKVSSVGPASAGSFVLANIIDKTGIQVKDVTGYKSGRTLVVAVARGDVDTTIKTTGGVVTFIKSGEVRGLVQLSSEKDKDPFFPDVPSARSPRSQGPHTRRHPVHPRGRAAQGAAGCRGRVEQRRACGHHGIQGGAREQGAGYPLAGHRQGDGHARKQPDQGLRET